MQRQNREGFSQLKLTETNVISGKVSFFCILGIHDYERITPQKIRVIYYIFTKNVIRNSSFKLRSYIKEFCQAKGSFLIENMCHSLALSLWDKYDGIDGLKVTIEKPDALMYAHHAYTTVVMYPTE
jgi:dihydroneopterin aldolase